MTFRSKQKHLIIVFLLVAMMLVFIKGYYNDRGKRYILSSAEDKGPINNIVEINNVKEQKIIIHIEGAVENPGVYELLEGARVNDAIIIAGGLLEEADRKRINLAKKISDEEFLYIPKVGEEIDEIINTSYTGSINDSKKLVNINTATKQELETLAGIGPALAERIINYRNEKGRFSSIEEIVNVNGIGEKKFDDIKNNITVK